MIEFKLPSLGADMDEGTLLEWQVQPGDSVKKGQTLCIIEAMKMMNNIESEYEGTLAKVFVEDGQPVQYGERLFAIKRA